MVFAEGVAKDLEVLEVGIFGSGVELYARHGKVEEDAVVDLAECCTVLSVSWKIGEILMIGELPCATLFDFGHVELKEAIDPGQEFLSSPSRMI